MKIFKEEAARYVQFVFYLTLESFDFGTNVFVLCHILTKDASSCMHLFWFLKFQFMKIKHCSCLLVFGLVKLECFMRTCPSILLYFHLKIFEWNFDVHTFVLVSNWCRSSSTLMVRIHNPKEGCPNYHSSFCLTNPKESKNTQQIKSEFNYSHMQNQPYRWFHKTQEASVKKTQ